MKCSIEGCNNKRERRTWCGKHYRRWQRHGDVEKTLKRANGTGSVYMDPAGYYRVQIGKKGYKLHRLIMEFHIGRKLTKTELVHHINERRDDNRIENLQIVTPGEHMVIHYKGKYRNSLNTKNKKECPRCKIVKLRKFFYTDKSGITRTYCIKCSNILYKLGHVKQLPGA